MPLCSATPPSLFCRAKLPVTHQQWTELDDFIMASITPTVLREVKVNIMQHVITRGGVYTYLVSKFGVMPAHHHHREHRHFINSMPGCSEHHLKLLSILREAQSRCKSLCICWLDLTNAFGSVHHDLIKYSLSHYHAPPEMTRLVSNIYDNPTAVISTKSWTTAPIHLQLGVYQGDPLSVIIFNTVMNTLVDSITQRCSRLGYSLSSISSTINLLQYADDTSLISDGPASCQQLLGLTEAWLSWSGM